MARPLQDSGDVLAGYGMKGSYELWQYFNFIEPTFFVKFTTEIEAINLVTNYYYQSYIQILDATKTE